MLKLGLLLLLLAGSSFAWWDASFPYRTQVNISNSGSNLTDYQVNLSLNTQALVSAGKMRSDCGDIRITNSTDSALPYWIETGCSGTATKIWVKVPSIPAGTSAIYAYYGNLSATYNNSLGGSNTFGVFNGFNTFTEADPGSKITVNDSKVSVALETSNPSRVYKTISSHGDFSFNFEISHGTFNSGTAANIFAMLLADNAGQYTDSGFNGVGVHVQGQSPAPPYPLNFAPAKVVSGTLTRGGNIALYVTNWYYATLTRNGTTLTLSIFTDSARTSPVSGSPVSLTGVPSTAYNVLHVVNNGNQGNNGDKYLYVQNAIARKSSSPEPTFAPGAEEEIPRQFTYRQPVTINNGGSALTNYPVNLTINTAALVAAGKMRSDCGDIRFTNSSSFNSGEWGVSYKYWIESGCNANATIWVRVPSISANGNTALHMYYGNATAASASNYNAAFIGNVIGGTITAFNNKLIHAFTSSGVFTSDRAMNAELLVVAGGGSGGADIGGGGGAGGLVYNSSYGITPGAYTVTIGAGGTGYWSGGRDNDANRGHNGDNSSFGTLTAIGGGAGLYYKSWVSLVANSGGSGGGGGGTEAGYLGSGGAGTAGQGYAGGNGLPYSGGGGGGAGGAGSAAPVSTTGGAGGIGLNYSITGSEVCYAGGGGGDGSNGAGVRGLATCGGGNGGTGNAAYTGQPGTANTGGGGGGGSQYQAGGNGGSGIVIVSYASRSYASPEPTVTTGTEQQPDTMPPAVTIQSPATVTYTTGTIPVNFTTTDDSTVSCTVRLNGTVNSSTCSNYTLTLANGVYTLNVTANDTAGNINSAQASFTVAASTEPQTSSSPQISTISGIADGNVTFTFTPAALKMRAGAQEFPSKALTASLGVTKIQIRARVTADGQTAPDGTKVTYAIFSQ